MRNKLPALLIALTACTGSPNYWRTYTPATGTTQQPIDRAKLAIVDAGYELETSDAALVVSKWFQGSGLGSNDVRFRIRVALSGGSYDIAAQCQNRGTLSSDWADKCEGDKRPQFVLDLVGKVEEAMR